MSGQFPPQPGHPSEINGMVEAFASVVEGRTAWYVSSPLTTGRRAFEWHTRNGSASADGRDRQGARGSGSFLSEVVEPNRAQAAKYVRDLRARAGQVVIDPTALEDIPGWNQDDYRHFWGRVIEGFAGTVIFREGWEYSSGCAYEFLVARKSAAATLKEDLEPLDFGVARSLIERAVKEGGAKGYSAGFLRMVGESLDSLPRWTQG